MMRLQRRLQLGRLTRQECKVLRATLLEIYEIISQGAQDIIDVRHSIEEVQTAHIRWQETMKQQTTGQTLITDYMVDQGGLTGRERRRQLYMECQQMEQPKRKATQAKLRDYYGSKRPRLD